MACIRDSLISKFRRLCHLPCFGRATIQPGEQYTEDQILGARDRDSHPGRAVGCSAALGWVATTGNGPRLHRPTLLRQRFVGDVHVELIQTMTAVPSDVSFALFLGLDRK